MKNPSGFDLLAFHNDISVASSRCCSHDILIKWERNKYNDSKKINNSADSAHGLWTKKFRFSANPSFIMIFSMNLHLNLFHFRHVFPAQACLDEDTPKPSDHTVRGRKSYAAKGQRRD